MVFAVMTAYGKSLILVDPAETALFAHTFRPRTRRRINGWRLGTQESGRLVSPLVGAGLFSLLGGGAVVALDAATFVAAAAATALLSRHPNNPGRRGPDGAPKSSPASPIFASLRHSRGS
ncbi:hypothetical protein [Streptomyces sp. NPDC056304]|uniref:hypothetical protein n=1 Tax=Streptomyces sp. NPDC056304 TaxID=3345778 RepID=UPI0035DCDB22